MKLGAAAYVTGVVQSFIDHRFDAYLQVVSRVGFSVVAEQLANMSSAKKRGSACLARNLLAHGINMAASALVDQESPCGMALSFVYRSPTAAPNTL